MTETTAVVAPEPINNTALVEEFRQQGGHILHIRANLQRGRRGMTFAYVPRSGRIEFSTSVVHRNDHFCKKNGTKVAIEHFKAGKTVVIPLNRDRTPVQFLRDTALFAL